jgi:hypothetical protein
MEFYGEYMEIYGYAMGFNVIFWKIFIFFQALNFKRWKESKKIFNDFK